MGAMGHGADDRNNATPRERLDAAGATDVAATLQALATPSRLYILARLQEGPCSVGRPRRLRRHGSLRLLPPAAPAARNLGLVSGERHGRSIVYSLYDNHVAELLEQALFHVEHLRLGLRDAPTSAAAPATTRR
ncbi:metalloregulator ArsR/SmtB family transcription factor [Streptomyces hirsutus]